MIEKDYALAPDSVFWTFQSEGHLRQQMAFVRFAGCSVQCPLCDTDYSVHMRMGAKDLAALVHLRTPRTVTDRWVWLTGGEPADRDLVPIIRELHAQRHKVAVATSGHKPIVARVDWLSVSPHRPDKWVQTTGNEVKVVPGLYGHSIEEFARVPSQFSYRWVQPLWDMQRGEVDKESLKECVEWMKHNPDWGLSMQDHKTMGWK